MPKKHIKQILILICLVGVLVMPYFVFAANGNGSGVSGPLKTLQNVAAGQEGRQGAYSNSTGATSFATILGTAVKAVLSLLGIIFIILMIYGGFMWMTASGDDEQVKKALSVIKNAIIGLIIVVGAYAIWAFISILVPSQTSPPTAIEIEDSHAFDTAYYGT